MAYQHFLADPNLIEERMSIRNNALTLFTKSENDNINDWRRNLAVTEIQTTIENLEENNIRIGNAGTVSPFPLPKNEGLEDFKKRLGNLNPIKGKLPEEDLFLVYPIPKIGSHVGRS
jgi:hypothetical protein